MIIQLNFFFIKSFNLQSILLLFFLVFTTQLWILQAMLFDITNTTL